MPDKQTILFVFTYLFEREFPSSANYANSHWHTWETRISYMHEKELDWLEEQEESWTGNAKDFADVYGDDYAQTTEITNSMYAALIVAIWSKIERRNVSTAFHFLKLEKKKAKACYRFETFKSEMMDHLQVDISQISDYDTVNAIREINNAFKHGSGSLNLNSKGYEAIRKSLVTQKALSALATDGPDWQPLVTTIQYDRLSIQAVLNSCNVFFSELLKSLKSACAPPTQP